MMMKMASATLTASLEGCGVTTDDVTTATLAALVSAARANYQAFRLSYIVSPAFAETGAIPDELTEEWILGSFAEVIQLLPADSPFREPLKRFAEEEGIAWAMGHADPPVELDS